MPTTPTRNFTLAPSPGPHFGVPAPIGANQMPACVIESALRILFHIRNIHDGRRAAVRAMVRADVRVLRGMAS